MYELWLYYYIIKKGEALFIHHLTRRSNLMYELCHFYYIIRKDLK